MVAEGGQVVSPGTIDEANNDLALAIEQIDEDVMIIQTDNKESSAAYAEENLQIEEEEGDDAVKDILPLNSAVEEGQNQRR